MAFKSPILFIYLFSLCLFCVLFSLYFSCFCLQFFSFSLPVVYSFTLHLVLLNISLIHYFYHLLGNKRPLEHLNSLIFSFSFNFYVAIVTYFSYVYIWYPDIIILCHHWFRFTHVVFIYQLLFLSASLSFYLIIFCLENIL